MTNSSFGYEMGGSGALLPLVNQELDGLNDNDVAVKADLGANYRLGPVKLSSMLTAGKFFNLNVGVHWVL